MGFFGGGVAEPAPSVDLGVVGGGGGAGVEPGALAAANLGFFGGGVVEPGALAGVVEPVAGAGGDALVDP